jgi:tetratricopeptide (TPR) repeat protein
MTTKAKTSAAKPSAPATGTTQPGSGSGLVEVLDRALQALHAKHFKEAETLLVEALKSPTSEQELSLVRRLRNTLASIHAHQAAEEDVKVSPESKAVYLLNCRDAEACVAFLESPAAGKTPSPQLLYLKATALAQLGKAEPAAESLKKALAGDPGLRFLYILEPDFNRVRSSTPFAGI